jgi:hypothetical protein
MVINVYKSSKKVIIPFTNHEVIVTALKSNSGDVYSCDEVKIFEKQTKKDVTKKILGVDYSYSSNGHELMVILDNVFKFENN